MPRHSSQVDQPIGGNLDDLFNQRVEQYLHHKVSVVNKNLIIVLLTNAIPDMSSTAQRKTWLITDVFYVFLF